MICATLDKSRVLSECAYDIISVVGNKRWRLSKSGEISDEISDRRISTRVYVTT